MPKRRNPTRIRKSKIWNDVLYNLAGVAKVQFIIRKFSEPFFGTKKKPDDFVAFLEERALLVRF